MAEEASTKGGPQRVEVTPDMVESLATKLDAFGEGLPDEERAVLRSVLNAGMRAQSSEVDGFMDIESYSWGLTSPLGAEVRRYDIVGAFPKKLDFGQMKAGESG